MTTFCPTKARRISDRQWEVNPSGCRSALALLGGKSAAVVSIETSRILLSFKTLLVRSTDPGRRYSVENYFLDLIIFSNRVLLIG